MNFFKNFFMLLILLAIFFLVTGCGSQDCDGKKYKTDAGTKIKECSPEEGHKSSTDPNAGEGISAYGEDKHDDNYDPTSDGLEETQDESVLAYRDAFSETFNMDISHIKFYLAETPFAEKKETTLAFCSMTYRNIYIRESEWSEMPDLQKESLIFHELGHCAANIPHDDAMMDSDLYILAEDGIGFYYYSEVPATIMNHILIDVLVYEALRDYYIEELQNRINNYNDPNALSLIP